MSSCGFVMRDGKICEKNTYRGKCRNHINLIQRELCVICEKPTANKIRACGRGNCRSRVNKKQKTIDDDDITMGRKEVDKLIKETEPTSAQLKKMDENEGKLKIKKEEAKEAKKVKEVKVKEVAKVKKVKVAKVKVAKETKTKTYCTGTTVAKNPCKRLAMNGTKTCVAHKN